MPAYTIQCTYAAYWASTVTVEASTLDEACRVAIQEANHTESWRALDHVGDTFIDFIRLGEQPHAYGVEGQIPVPYRFTEEALSDQSLIDPAG